MNGMEHQHMDHSGHSMDPVDHRSHNSYDHMDSMHSEHNMFNISDDMKQMTFRTNEGEIMHHEQAQGHSMHAMHDMAMTFHGGYQETILFSWWKVTDLGEFVGSFFAIFIMALFYEGLKYYRKHLLWKTYSGLQYCAVAPPDKGVANICAVDEPQVIQPVPHLLERNVCRPTMLSTAHAWQTVLHGVQVLVSYMLMLVFMTYNTYLCAAVVFGSATGYFLFGWRESIVVDFTEHCH